MNVDVVLMALTRRDRLTCERYDTQVPQPSAGASSARICLGRSKRLLLSRGVWLSALQLLSPRRPPKPDGVSAACSRPGARCTVILLSGRHTRRAQPLLTPDALLRRTSRAYDARRRLTPLSAQNLQPQPRPSSGRGKARSTPWIRRRWFRMM